MQDLKLNDGSAIPRLGLGTWRFGETLSGRQQEADSVRLALELGYRLIDTAEMYGEGGAESVVGSALKQAFSQGFERSQVTVVSKVYPHHAGRKAARDACDASRKRLGLDTIDLYLLHWRGSVPLLETIEAFLELQAKGAIRQWGVSNFDVDDLHELARITGQLNVAPCPVNQIYYALPERGPEVALLPMQSGLGMVTMAYSPLNQGTLSDHAELAKIGRDLGVSANQLALAFLLHQDLVMPIPKASSRRHLEENLAALSIKLDAVTLMRIEQLFPAPKQKKPLAMI
jgi:diketogulonate reductase-like aldo/keto reductase